MSTDVTETPKKKASSVAPFVAELTGNCCDIVVQSIPGARLRGAVTHLRKVFNPQRNGQEEMAPSGIIPGTPDIPGMQLHVNPGLCRVKIVDPLRGNDDLCSSILRVLKSQHVLRTAEKVEGVPTREEKLEPSRMKTLCREIFRMVKDDMAVIKKGPPPTMDEIDDLPGHYLLNPGSHVQNHQPKYEKDLENFVENLTRAGA